MLRTSTRCRSCSGLGLMQAPFRVKAPRPSSRSLSRTSTRRGVACGAEAVRELSVVYPVHYSQQELCPVACKGVLVGVAVLIATASAVAYKLLIKEPKQNLQAEYGSSLYPPPNPDKDPESHRLALARSRQAFSVQKAVVNMKAGEPARAVVDIGKALQENSICRSPLMCGHHKKEELLDLYRLHLKYNQVPPHFAVLLQLREMLGINKVEAEQVEQEVFATGEAFAI